MPATVALLVAVLAAGLIVVVVARLGAGMTPTTGGTLERRGSPPARTTSPLSAQAIASACGLTPADYLDSPTGFATIVNQLERNFLFTGYRITPRFRAFWAADLWGTSTTLR
jgi:hypothetical protein